MEGFFMRKWGIWIGILWIIPWMISLICVHLAGSSEIRAESAVETGSSEDRTESMKEKESEGVEPKTGSRRILVEREKTMTYMTLEDYLPGVIICQINADYQMEALKCQAVIARTYICRLMGERSEIREEELDLDYLGEPDLHILQDRETAIQKLSRCEQAVRETEGVVMKYEGRYILPLFHGRSAGRTRSGADEFPYLKAQESGWDVEGDGYLTEHRWSMRTFASQFGESAETLSIQIVEKDDSGYVLQVKIGTKLYSGEDVQYALGLASPCFRMSEKDGVVSVVTMGSGHGYGFSQYGANHMAQEGWTYTEILYHYYKNISLEAA